MDNCLLDAFNSNLNSFGRERWLWRGVDDTSELLVLRETLKERRPSDTPLNVHNAVNEWFMRNIGFPYRSASLFCTGSLGVAKTYGRTYRIVPVDNWEICWSPIVKDLHDSLYSRTEGFRELDELPSILCSFGYRCGNIDEAITSGNEIMLKCDQYFALLNGVVAE